jgi:hypothetical protein
MRWSLLVTLVLLPGLAGAQSLGEAARKEKERRKRLEESGVKPRELTDKDLRSGKGAVANDPANTSADAAGQSSAPATSADEEDERRRREEAGWRQRVARARARADEARQYYEYLNSLSLSPGEYYVDENGKPVYRTVEELRSAIAKAKAESEAAEKALENLLESARRDNVPPGWLR